MTNSSKSGEFRYLRSRAARFRRNGAPPKTMPQSDISFQITATCESIDLLIRQFNSGLGCGQKTFCIRELLSLFALYQIIKHGKIQAVFPNVETILRLFFCLMVTNCSGERSFSKLYQPSRCLGFTDIGQYNRFYRPQ